MSAPSVVRSVAALRSQVRAWRGAGLRVGFVPTMGALHDGHLALVREAMARCERAMASIFVNPTQFAPHEDLSRYPRDEAGDLAKLASVGTHLAFLPTLAEMYPEGASTWVEVEGLSKGLCAERRPHHFRGMATVVTMLLNQAQADVAVFGEKDYQQLLIVRRLVRDLAIPTEIVGGRTVREGDGLAMSSRNLLLTPEHRRLAPMLHRVLTDTAAEVADGRLAAPVLQLAAESLQKSGFRDVDYVELRDAETLAPLVAVGDRPARVLGAAFLGPVRLIDNVPVTNGRSEAPRS